MLILQPMPLNWQMDTNPDGSAMDTNNNLVKIVDLEVIRKSAEQVVCYREDMVYAPGRSNLMTMQPPPSSAKELSNVVHASKATVGLSLPMLWYDADNSCSEMPYTR